MPVEIVTKEDLNAFRILLLNDIKDIVAQISKHVDEPINGYKTSHVRSILGCSVNKLVSLRVSKKLRAKKVGGTLYYNKEDVSRLLNEGY